MGDVNGVLIKGRVRSRGTGPTILTRNFLIASWHFLWTSTLK